MAKKKALPKAEPTSEPPLRLVYMSPSDLVENPRNWRVHPEAQLSALTDVIGEVGWAGACLYNSRTERLIDGHARRKVALDQGSESVPVLVGDWSEEDEAKILATLDPLAAMATADAARLADLLHDVSTGSEALQAMLSELAEDSGVGDTIEPGAGGDEFDATPDDGPCRVEKGDVWLVGGKHRVMCGDSTDADSVAILMAGEKADLVVTDPPYGVDFKRGQFITDPSRRAGRTRGVCDEIDGDHRKADDQAEFIRAVFTVARPHLRPAASVYMFSATLAEGSHSMLGLAAAGVHIQSQLVWVKNNLVLGIADYHWKHEICWYGWYEGEAHRWFGDRNKVTVLDYARVQATWHPNEKPIALIESMISNSSLSEEVIYEPFGGSGTTLIASHRLGRSCRAMELDPKFCEAILRRAEAEGLTVEKET